MQIFHNSCIKNMSISESSLHPYIKGFVEEYGKLTVTDLIKYLREVLDLSKDDLEPLAGRSDDKFSQKVRNLVSHSPEGISEKNGYIINKNTIEYRIIIDGLKSIQFSFIKDKGFKVQ